MPAMLLRSGSLQSTKLSKMKNRIKKSLSQTPPAKPVTHTGALHSSVGFPGYSLNKIVRKVRATVLVLFFLALTACNHKKHVNQPATQATKPVLVVHLNDYSHSTAPICFFDSTSARKLYYAIAKNGGGTIKHCRVLTNSVIQDVFTLQVGSLDTDATSGITNIYKAQKTKSTNQKKLEKFNAQATKDIARYVAEIYRPHNESQTDLTNALNLAKTALETNVYDDHTKYLIISSDMINNPKGIGDKSLKPIELSNTRILAIRPAISADSLQAIFPNSSVYLFTDADDAISFITKYQNQ